MSDFDNTNRGQIWGNDKKTTDTHPDFKGSINIEGKEYWLSGWKRKPGAHPKAPALSLSVQAKEAAPQQQAPQQQYTPAQQQAPQQAYQMQAPQQQPEPPAPDQFDDDIPF